MLLEIINVITIRKNGRPIPGHRCHIKCDNCGKEWIGGYLKCMLNDLNNPNVQHYCSSMCNNTSEIKKAKIRATCLEKFGVESAMQAESVKRHQSETMQRKYGVDYACQIPHVYAATHSPEAVINRHKAKLRNGTYKKSKVEVELYEMLLKHIQVVSQVWIPPRYSIDMKFEQQDCLLQFDGIHWHGLDGKDYTTHASKHDDIIHSKFLLDRELDELVFQNSMRLIRITDIWFKEHRDIAVSTILQLIQTDWVGVKYIGHEFSIPGRLTREVEVII